MGSEWSERIAGILHTLQDVEQRLKALVALEDPWLIDNSFNLMPPPLYRLMACNWEALILLCGAENWLFLHDE